MLDNSGVIKNELFGNNEIVHLKDGSKGIYIGMDEYNKRVLLRLSDVIFTSVDISQILIG